MNAQFQSEIWGPASPFGLDLVQLHEHYADVFPAAENGGVSTGRVRKWRAAHPEAALARRLKAAARRDKGDI